MGDTVRVKFNVLQEITVSARVRLPQGEYAGTVTYGAVSTDRPVAKILMAMLEIDPELANRLNAPFRGTTASIFVNITAAIAEGHIVVVGRITKTSGASAH